jgi:transcriptional regulator with GAF, ATPase, and Fis domain
MPTGPLLSSDNCRRLLLAMSQQPSTDDVLRVLVTGLTEQCHAALARVWLVAPKAHCGGCPQSEVCDLRTDCLQLRASSGRSVDGTDWSGIKGRFAQVPFGFGKVGHIAETRLPVEEKRIGRNTGWIADYDWVRQERIRGLIGQPLLHQNNLLGVLAVFTRQSPTDDDLAWLRAFADHAAVAVAHSQAFAEVQDLRSRLEFENEYLRGEVKATQSNGEIIGISPAVRNLQNRIRLVGPTVATVLIQGESGTGKELVARAIHEQSERAGKPMITVNCAAVPHELFESEFFGHVKGAFSGATRDRAGRFELADKGTLFLDEVGEIPLTMQGKLLRVLEQGTFERIGDERTLRPDVRVIAATNRNLNEEVRRRRFRRDLFYRLSVFLLDVPALRERTEDIMALTRHFLAQYSRKYQVKEPRLTREHVEILESYTWPGNVRELRNVIERSVIAISSQDASQALDFSYLTKTTTPSHMIGSQTKLPTEKLLTEHEMRQLERDNLIAVLQRTNWKVSGAGGAAAFLGMNPATLASRLRAFHISRSQNVHIDGQ